MKQVNSEHKSCDQHTCGTETYSTQAKHTQREREKENWKWIQNVDVQRPKAFQGSGTAQWAPVFEPLFIAIIRTYTDNSEHTIIILITM